MKYLKRKKEKRFNADFADLTQIYADDKLSIRDYPLQSATIRVKKGYQCLF